MIRHLGIQIHEEDPDYVNDFSSKLFHDYYVRDYETIPMALARASTAYCYGDYDLAQRIYNAAYKGWFMFASPVLSNAPEGRWEESEGTHPEDWVKHTWVGEDQKAQPISCFALTVPDNIDGQMETAAELSALSVAGGGVGLHNQIRATTDKAPGPIPYMKVLDSTIGYYRQSRTRRGACAMYMDDNHPDIIEHVNFRVPSGGDPARKSDNRTQFHSAVNISDAFIKAIDEDADWELKCPHTGEVRDTIKARFLWEEILETRALTGEPYLFKIDTANRALPQSQKDLGLKVNGSNICIEVTLPTSEERTFVCCLSSENIEKFDEWKDTGLTRDLTRYLDNVLQKFIDTAPDTVSKAVYAAQRERAIGIGQMGWHYYLQSKGIPFESGGFNSAIQHTHIIYKHIKDEAVAESRQLAKERGEAPDMVGSGLRNSHLLACAPNANNSILIQTSASIELLSSNAFSHSTRAGTFLVKNKYLDKLLHTMGDEDWVEEQWRLVVKDNGSAQGLECLNEEQKKLFLTAFEVDQHWVVEQGEARAQYICQSQSLNLFFPAGTDRAYMNSVHLAFLKAPHLKSAYYLRTTKEVKADTARQIQRVSLKDFEGDECLACSG